MDNRRGGKFSFGHIIGDPFALATISIAIVSYQWQAGERPTLTVKPACLADSIHLICYC